MSTSKKTEHKRTPAGYVEIVWSAHLPTDIADRLDKMARKRKETRADVILAALMKFMLADAVAEYLARDRAVQKRADKAAKKQQPLARARKSI